MQTNIDILITQIFDGEALDASGTATSAVIDLGKTANNEGRLQWKIPSTSGLGVVKIELLESLNGTDWVENGTDLATGLAKGTGDGFVSFDPDTVKFVKFKITETGTSAAVVFSLWLATR